MSAGIRPNGIGVLAESRGVRECLAFFTREKLWIHEQHVALCRIPAPTTAGGVVGADWRQGRGNGRLAAYCRQVVVAARMRIRHPQRVPLGGPSRCLVIGAKLRPC